MGPAIAAKPAALPELPLLRSVVHNGNSGIRVRGCVTKTPARDRPFHVEFKGRITRENS
jgi:hypothetical protein